MKRNVRLIFWWIFWILLLELTYKVVIFKNLFDLNTLYIILFSLPWVFLFNFLTTIFSAKLNKILTILFSALLMVLTLAQIVYYNFYNSIFSVFSLTKGTGQVMEFWTAILNVILNIWYVFLIIIIIFVLFLVFKNKIFTFKRSKWYVYVINFVLLIISVVSICFTIIKNDKGIYSLKRLVLETHAPLLTVNKIGLLSTEAIDLYRYVNGFEEKMYEQEAESVTEIIDDAIEYNMLDIDFEALISKTKNSKEKSMHKYFSSVTPTQKNKYTGLFKDKNLIYITAEGFDVIALDEKLTPNLYKIANNGFVFNNYYQPLFPVSTSDGEYMTVTSLIPKEGVWSFSKSSKIDMPFGLGTMFKNIGYNSYAFHNHSYKYYDRHLSHPNLGFTYYGCRNGLEKLMNCKRWPNSDDEMMDVTTKYYLDEDKPFATYYMTVSGHLNYNFYGNSMASRNKKAVSNLPYSTAVKAYFATQIELDKAIGNLMEQLEEAGKLDDTLIVIAPDHYPYGLTTSEMNEVSDSDRSNKFEKFHTTLIMYNSFLEKMEVNKVVSSLDILPTVYNLFGLEYDSRLLMGNDIFSEKEGLVILSDRSWVTDKGTYNAVNKKFTKNNDIEEEVTQEYIDSINTIVYQKFSMSSLILDLDYYSKLGL